MIIHYLVADLGDGSASIRFFRSYEEAEQRIMDDPDQYGMNDVVNCIDTDNIHYQENEE